MMQTGTLPNPQPKVSSAGVSRTRCPACMKLFAVETDVLLAMTRAGVFRAEFNCTSDLCRTAFAVQLPLPVGYDGVAILPSVQIFPPSEAIQVDVPLSPPNPKEPAQEAPVAALKAPIAERECPRCNAKNAVTMNECVRCGIVFERYENVNDSRIEEEVALGGTRELAAIWDKVIEDYEDRVRHDRFLNACRDGRALSYAAKKYSQILVSAPQDDIARLMRNKVVALVAAQAETSKLPIRLGFRIPKLNSMALFMGSLLFVWGLAMPQLKNIMEIGLSMVLLAIGVRVALRSRI